jgi:predicted nucleic acid-binding protein
LVSALISPAGNEALILLAVRQGLIKPSFSEEVLEEYAEVLARPKFALPGYQIDALIAFLRSQQNTRDEKACIRGSLSFQLL